MTLNGKQLSLPSWDMTKPVVSLTVDGEVFTLQIHGRGNGPVWTIGFQGATYEFKLLAPYTESLLRLMPLPKSSESAKELLSPMPGVVRGVAVKVGDKVFKGQEVCVIEAMKMQNKLVIGSDGVVKEVRVKEGDTVSDEDLLISLE